MTCRDGAQGPKALRNQLCWLAALLRLLSDLPAGAWDSLNSTQGLSVRHYRTRCYPALVGVLQHRDQLNSISY